MQKSAGVATIPPQGWTFILSSKIYDSTVLLYLFRYSIVSLDTENDESRILGTMLVEMLEERKIKMEIFPDKSAYQVSGFTSKVLMYER